MSSSLIAIINPTAGSGRGLAIWQQIAQELHEVGLHPEQVLTAAHGEAEVLARAAVDQGYRTVVAVGGDGTIHEIVNGLMRDGSVPPNLRLGVVPAGTGLDFARNLGLPKEIPAIVDRLVRGEARLLDLGLCLEPTRYFVNFAESGLGAAVVARERHLPQRLPGRLSFFLAAAWASLDRPLIAARVVVDGTVLYDGPLVSVVVANGPYLGGGMRLAPRASMDDGLLNVVILGDFSRRELLGHLWKVYPGTHLTHPKVFWQVGRTVQVELAESIPLDLDGELVTAGKRFFTVLPHVLPVLV